MAFFKDFGKQVTDIAQTVGKRTGEAAEVGRLNARKQGVRQQIEALYGQIGKAYFATREGSVHDQADMLCQQAVDLQAEIERLNRMIDKIKRQRRCPDCGQVQPDSARFCASCGARLPEDEPEPEPEPPQAQPQAPENLQVPEGKGDVEVEITWPQPGKAQEEEEQDN